MTARIVSSYLSLLYGVARRRGLHWNTICLAVKKSSLHLSKLRMQPGASLSAGAIDLSSESGFFNFLGLNMKKLLSIGIAAIVLVGVAGCAQDGMMKRDSMQGGMAMKDGMGMQMMKMMDTNGDGMISKDEFMKHHEAMYDNMKKGSNGMVSMMEMQRMMDEMMMMKK